MAVDFSRMHYTSLQLLDICYGLIGGIAWDHQQSILELCISSQHSYLHLTRYKIDSGVALRILAIRIQVCGVSARQR